MCWEITGCGRQNDCKVWQLAKSNGKPCWEVVSSFDDYRTALNVCGDCIVSVLTNGQRSRAGGERDDLGRVEAEKHSVRCPGMSSS